MADFLRLEVVVDKTINDTWQIILNHDHGPAHGAQPQTRHQHVHPIADLRIIQVRKGTMAGTLCILPVPRTPQCPALSCRR